MSVWLESVLAMLRKMSSLFRSSPLDALTSSSMVLKSNSLAVRSLSSTSIPKPCAAHTASISSRLVRSTADAAFAVSDGCADAAESTFGETDPELSCAFGVLFAQVWCFIVVEASELSGTGGFHGRSWERVRWVENDGGGPLEVPMP